MSTHALGSSSAPNAARALRLVDLAVLALALPVFLAAELPLLGYAVCAGVWIGQRALGLVLSRRAAASTSARTSTGLLAVSLVTRVWLLALAILVAGLIDRDAGLPAAVLAAAVFQVYFTAQMLARSVERGAPRGAEGGAAR